MSHINVKDGVTSTCPFCGEEFVSSIQLMTVFHTVRKNHRPSIDSPTGCINYDNLHPTEYLKAVNQRRLS